LLAGAGAALAAALMLPPRREAADVRAFEELSHN
jgi:hypothetical protein